LPHENDKNRLLAMFCKMYLIRKYEEKIYYLFLEGSMPGTIHQSHGQEACAVGMTFDLDKKDYITSTHRPAGHCLAKGVPLKDMMAEMFAKSTGCCRGKGGAMHTGDPSTGVIPAIAIVGGGIPISVGIGLSCKLRHTKNVVVCFMGDGATNEGAFHESLNAASIWKLPVIFACENNLYGASTRISKVVNIDNLSDRSIAYGIPGEAIDGNDVLAVQKAAQQAIKRARDGEGPTFLELRTYRIGGHSRNDACNYRDKDEEKTWFDRDPIKLMRQYLLDSKLCTETEIKNEEGKIEKEIDEAVLYAKSQPDPLPEDALEDVFAGGGTL
jgi:acetoin:2,6-dichlorophenolindophenol oxidoreductase subunit alpha